MTYQDNCYIMADGECISPLPCEHGDPLPLDVFVEKVRSEDRARLLYLAKNAGYDNLDDFCAKLDKLMYPNIKVV